MGKELHVGNKGAVHTPGTSAKMMWQTFKMKAIYIFLLNIRFRGDASHLPVTLFSVGSFLEKH